MDITLRYGAAGDVGEILAWHERCSPDAVYRRYHVPVPTPSKRLVRRLLLPTGGFSMLALLGPKVVGMTCAGPLSPKVFEVGLLVEDDLQRRGIGSRLLAATAYDAAVRGHRALVCLTQPGNHAVAPTVAGAGLGFESHPEDGLTRLTIALDDILRLPA